MRSFDRSMPEELNRVLVDHASALLLCSSEVAMANLRHEGVCRPDGAGRRRDGRRRRRGPARARERDRPGGGARPRSRASTCWRPRTGRATSMIPTRLERLVELLRRDAAAGVAAAAPADRGAAARGAGLLDALRDVAVGDRDRAARVLRADRAAVQRQGRPDRFRRAAEGGLSGARCRASRCAPAPSGPRPSSRAGTCSSISTPRPRVAALERPPPADSIPSSTATDVPANASSRRLHCCRHEVRVAVDHRMSRPLAYRRRRTWLLGPEPGAQLRRDRRMRARVLL